MFSVSRKCQVDVLHLINGLISVNGNNEVINDDETKREITWKNKQMMFNDS